jgi:hypothetical protein
VNLLKSTASARGDAREATRALAARIASEPGWDAVVIDAQHGSALDKAVSVGAEIYVIGQYIEGSPGRVSATAINVATEKTLSDFSYEVTRPNSIPPLAFAAIMGSPAGIPVSGAGPSSISIPSGELISVVILSDIGSRISQEGDTFAVMTAQDYYYKGQLILPKGSPGYGVITHLKRAGSFHAGGELNFTVKRLVTPDKTDVLVETNGATADADKSTEQNGNAFGQYLLWGIGMFAKRGNDILIKKSTTFHVATLENANVPIAKPDSAPAPLDPVQVTVPPEVQEQVLIAPRAPEIEPSAQPVNETAPPVQTAAAAAQFLPPPTWVRLTGSANTNSSMDIWAPAPHDASGERVMLSVQETSENVALSQFAQSTLDGLRTSFGPASVLASRPQRICRGTQDGWYVETRAFDGVRWIIGEQVLGVSARHTFVASYTRPENATLDSAAAGVLTTLCPS